MNLSLDLIKEIAESSSNFGNFLKFIYNEIKSHNSQYSVRAFAKSLHVSHAYLQRIINGETKASDTFMKDVASKLGLPKKYLNIFLQLSEKTTLKDISLANKEQTSYLDDSLQLIIFSLLNLNDCSKDIKWIYQTLDQSEREIQHALNKLIEAELVSEVSLGKFQITKNKSIKIPHQEGEKDCPIIMSLRNSFKDTRRGDQVEYIYIPAHKDDIEYIRRSVSSNMMEITKRLPESTGDEDEVFEIVTFIRPIIEGHVDTKKS